MKYSEERLQEALLAIENGLPVAKASKEYGIPRGTLRHRIEGAISLKERASHQKLISDYEETCLAHWIEVQAMVGQPPTHQTVRLAAESYLKAAGDTRKPGKNWTLKFLARHPHLKTLSGKSHDIQRSKGVEPDQIKGLFNALNHPHIRTIRAANRWNFDETGLAEGAGYSGKVIAPAEAKGGKKRRYALVKGSGIRTWVTVIEAVNAEGNSLAPVVIFKGESIQAQWFPLNIDEFGHWKFASSTNGWTNNDIGLGWLQEHFLPLTAPGAKDWRLLVLDGHGSHLTDEFLASCVVNRVFIVQLPAHSSHVTQPLDVGCFAPLKAFFRSGLSNTQIEELGVANMRQIFLKAYLLARQKAFSLRNVRAAWRATGLWPLDINQVLSNEFVVAAAPESPKAPDLSTDFEPQGIPTPKGGKELRNLVFRGRSQKARLSRTERAVISKAAKALDVKNVDIARLQAIKEVLEGRIERLKPKKRKKVIPSLGQRLVQIAQIQGVQQLAEINGYNNTTGAGLEDIELGNLFQE